MQENEKSKHSICKNKRNIRQNGQSNENWIKQNKIGDIGKRNSKMQQNV